MIVLMLCTACDNNNKTNTPNTHNHDFINGYCSCGEKDPNADSTNIPQHTHTFIDGKCQCGSLDPNWTVPETPPANLDDDQIQFNGFEFIENETLGEHYYIRLDNNVTETKLYELIETGNNVKWTLCKDLECTKSIPSKTITLKEGNNVYYVLKEDSKNNVEIYKINVYRNKIVSVSFDGLQTIKVEESKLITPPTDIVNPGYSFAAWDYDFTVPAPNMDLKIKGIWDANTYTITFKSNIGTGTMASITAKTGETVVIPTITFDNPGYHVSGWTYTNKYAKVRWAGTNGEGIYFQETNLSCQTEFTMVGHNVVLTAEWEANTNTVNFIDKFNTLSQKEKTVTAKTDTKVDIPWTGTVSGYTFQGWSTTENGDVVYKYYEDYPVGVQSEQNLYAVWKPIHYSITYNCRVATKYGVDITNLIVENPNPTNFTIESDDIVFQPIVITGYTFLGWYSSNGDPVDSLTISHGSINSRDLYAIFEPQQFTIHYDVNGGTLSTTEQLVSYSKPYILKEPIKEGHTFTGWVDQDGELWFNGTWKLLKDVNLKATWSVKSYKVMLSLGTGGTANGDGTWEYGTQVVLNAEPYLGYDFDGWYINNTLVSSELSYCHTITAANTTISVKFKVKDEMEIFKFTSTGEQCIITGTNNNRVSTYNIPAYVTEIDDGAFSMNSYLTTLVIPNGVTRIGSRAFSSCNALEEIILPNTLTYIGTSAFAGCSKLLHIDLPESLTTIDERAFNQTNMESITIPYSVIFIGEYAFSGCTDLMYIYFNGTIEEWRKVTVGNDWNFIVPAKCVQCIDGQIYLKD